MKKKSLKIRLGIIINAAIFAAGLAAVTFSDGGLIKFFSLKKKLDSVNRNIFRTQKDISRLQKEIDSLKTDMSKIERVAREKYYMKRPDEIVIDVEEYKK